MEEENVSSIDKSEPQDEMPFKLGISVIAEVEGCGDGCLHVCRQAAFSLRVELLVVLLFLLYFPQRKIAVCLNS